MDVKAEKARKKKRDMRKSETERKVKRMLVDAMLGANMYAPTLFNPRTYVQILTRKELSQLQGYDILVVLILVFGIILT